MPYIATCWDILLQHGADPAIANSKGETPFFSANLDELRLIAEHAPSFDMSTKNADGETRLHIAVGKDDKSTVELLIELGADRKAQNARGQTPCQLARQRSLLQGEPALGALCRP